MANFHPIAPAGDIELILEEHSESTAARLDRLFQNTPTAAGLDFHRSDTQPMQCSQKERRFVERKPWESRNLVYNKISTETKVSNEQPDHQPEAQASTISEEDTALLPSENCVRIQVSSQHLILVSPYFKRNLESGMLESHILSSEGRVSMPMKDQNPEVMLVVMNIIHGRTRKVPRQINLDFLTEIAILVDYLKCHEVVEPFSDMWIENLESSITYIYSKKLIQWLCISTVFQRKDIFTNLTNTAILQANGLIETLGLPIPKSVVGAWSITPTSGLILMHTLRYHRSASELRNRSTPLGS